MVVLGGTCDRLKCPARGFALFFYLRFYGTTVISILFMNLQLRVLFNKASRTKIQELYSLFNHSKRCNVPISFAC